MRLIQLLIALSGLLLLGLPFVAASQTFTSEDAQFRLETVADGLEHPWGLAFLPDGSMLVTERAGRLRVIQNGKLLPQAVRGLPAPAVSGQGGLFDIILHPDFKENKTLFLSYAHRSNRGMTTRVARALFEERALKSVTVIFEALPRSNTSRHFGGRMAFDASGYLYISVGDRGEMDRAQDTRDDAGGVHRITVNGEPAPGNPGLDDPNINNTFFTWGNRNIQGMTVHPETGDIWTHEHGPRGGDEINILNAGTNYGWPEITYGIGYSGLPITLDTKREGMAQPLHYWDPSIAPSGMAFYTGAEFPKWQGSLFVGALKLRKLVRLEIENGKVVSEEDLLTSLKERIRDVRTGPDGTLWLLTDSPQGKVYRVVPAQ
ncbi:MAG: PQQ-dependent sugar dehydrogenase [Marinobacter sp.]|uniref:PQQ-dependent sugar dehydrogenase n=1 Tax=Marinobacter sp. TaxID=50741 RepID=UPI001B4D3F60|nr:PQQ-dependent sugar dehydrogenase [Marinobacter sp.]MBQ0746863.1 PQQ-dependent sugar dehydrogenase [Marinobacter sp.]MBQ0814319.1 PQQ-dependent sugar dehydrogenase [Marinobacter sp.]